VAVADSGELDLTGDFTIESWINLFEKPTDVSPTYRMAIVSHRDNTNSWEFDIKNSAANLALFKEGSTALSSSTGLSTNRWYHVAATYNKDNTLIKLFINGKLDNSGSYNLSINPSSSDVVIGKKANSSNYYFNGLIDDVRIYNYAKSAQEIEADYNAGAKEHLVHIQATDANLVSLWHLDGNAWQTTALDSAGSNNGTLTNFDFWDLNSGWVEGKFGNALRFDGSNDYVSVPNSSDLLLNGDFSIECWAKRAGKVSGTCCPGILRKGNAGTANGYLVFYAENENRIYFKRNNVQDPGPATFTIGSGWHHFVVVHTVSDKKTRIYQDGALANTVIRDYGTNAGTDVLKIGMGDSKPINGLIDEVAVYNRALTETEIKDHYYAFVNKGMVYSPGAIKQYEEG